MSQNQERGKLERMLGEMKETPRKPKRKKFWITSVIGVLALSAGVYFLGPGIQKFMDTSEKKYRFNIQRIEQNNIEYFDGRPAEEEFVLTGKNGYGDERKITVLAGRSSPKNQEKFKRVAGFRIKGQPCNHLGGYNLSDIDLYLKEDVYTKKVYDKSEKNEIAEKEAPPELKQPPALSLDDIANDFSQAKQLLEKKSIEEASEKIDYLIKLAEKTDNSSDLKSQMEDYKSKVVMPGLSNLSEERKRLSSYKRGFDNIKNKVNDMWFDDALSEHSKLCEKIKKDRFIFEDLNSFAEEVNQYKTNIADSIAKESSFKQEYNKIAIECAEELMPNVLKNKKADAIVWEMTHTAPEKDLDVIKYLHPKYSELFSRMEADRSMNRQLGKFKQDADVIFYRIAKINSFENKIIEAEKKYTEIEGLIEKEEYISAELVCNKLNEEIKNLNLPYKYKEHSSAKQALQNKVSELYSKIQSLKEK